MLESVENVFSIVQAIGNNPFGELRFCTLEVLSHFINKKRFHASHFFEDGESVLECVGAFDSIDVLRDRAAEHHASMPFKVSETRIEDFAAATPEALGKDIYSTGFYNNKAKSIIGAAKRILSVFGGEVPADIDSLLSVPGAARKTANVVLGTAFGIASGVVVDTHVSRISQRLDLTRFSDPVRIEKDLVRILPRDRWISFSHQLIHHGRNHCKARNPNCRDCPLNHLCYAKDKNA